MRLNNADFKRFKELSAKKDLSDKEKTELSALKEKRDSKPDGKGSTFSFKPGNDFSWWSKVPSLLKDAVNLPLNWIPGTQLFETAGTGPVSTLRIKVQNTYGSEDSATGPINLMARNIYLAMHRNYRGLNAYQSADVGMVIIATIELFCQIAAIERVYGVINKYSLLNRTLPYALLNAMGISSALADNIRDNLADFRYGLNRILVKAQNVCIPKDLSILMDKIALFGYIYKDHESDKAQSIVFTFDQIGRYDGAAADTGGGIVYTALRYGATYATMLKTLSDSVDSLVEDSDVLRIYSDFVAYIKPENLMTLILVPEDYTLVPVYSEEILHKLHNAYSTGYFYNIDQDNGTFTENGAVEVRELVPASITLKAGLTAGVDRVITQNDNVIVTRNCLYASGSAGSVKTYTSGELDGYKAWEFGVEEVIPSADYNGHKQIFDTYRREADPATMLEGCLFKYTPKSIGRTRLVTSCAWEVIIGFEGAVVVNGVVKVQHELYQYLYWSGYDSGMTLADVKSIMSDYLNSTNFMSQIDWAPILYKLNDDDVASLFIDINAPIHGDIDNCRMVGFEDLYRMHEVAVFSGCETTVALVKD